MKKCFKEIFHLPVSDAQYEPIEDFFLNEVYPKLQVTPAQFDRVIFNHYEDLRR